MEHEYRMVTKGIYSEAHDYLIREKGWSADMIAQERECGRMWIIGWYLSDINGAPENGSNMDIQYGFDNKFNNSGNALNSPPFYGRLFSSFEETVAKEYDKFGYSETLNISIEDCQTPGSIDIDDVEEVLEYLIQIRESFDNPSRVNNILQTIDPQVL